MPKFPQFAERASLITGSVFEKFSAKTRDQGRRLVSLHIGDSYEAPPYDLPIDANFLANHPGFNRYCDTFGVYALREALAEKLGSENRLDVTPNEIMMTAGACNALNVSMQGLVDPGEEVLILTPNWPFIRGMVRLAGGRVIEVPLYTRLCADPSFDIRAQLERALTPATVALYLNTPNNPSGKVLDRGQLRPIAEFVRDHNLWLVSDEAYDGMTFDGREHVSVASLPEMFDRTLSMFTFSKVYMFSGLRLGYVVAPSVVLECLNRIMVHQLYSPSTLGQQMMVAAVTRRSTWKPAFVDHIQGVRDRVLDGLAVSPQKPEGAYYLFFSITPFLQGRKYWDVINACFDSGVSVAPGEDFGSDYHDYVRICFAGEPPDRLALAIERLNTIFPG